MAPKEPQPRVEGVSLSGAMAQQGGKPTSRSSTGVSSTTQRRVARNAISCEQTLKDRKASLTFIVADAATRRLIACLEPSVQFECDDGLSGPSQRD
jgi:hypothetical protein